MHVMYVPENFHPAGSWNGWMTKSDCIVDKPPMIVTTRLGKYRTIA
jgi:hypothetical protein